MIDSLNLFFLLCYIYDALYQYLYEVFFILFYFGDSFNLFDLLFNKMITELKLL